MGRNAESISYSLMPDDLARWKRHEQERGVGRSDLLRHALDLLDREMLVDKLRVLQDLGDAAVAARGLTEGEIDDLIRQSLGKAEADLSTEVRELVEIIAQPVEPRRRKRRPLPTELRDDHSSQ